MMITEKDPYEFDPSPQTSTVCTAATATLDSPKIDNFTGSASAVTVEIPSSPATKKRIRIKSGPNSSSKRKKVRAESSSPPSSSSSDKEENQSASLPPTKTTNTATTTTTTTKSKKTTTETAAAATNTTTTITTRATSPHGTSPTAAAPPPPTTTTAAPVTPTVPRSKKRARSPNATKKKTARSRSKLELQASTISGVTLITTSRTDQYCETTEILKSSDSPGCCSSSSATSLSSSSFASSSSSSSPCAVVANGIEMKGVVIIKLSEPSSPQRSEGARTCSPGSFAKSSKKLWASSSTRISTQQTASSFVDLIARRESLFPPIEPIVEINIPSPRDASAVLLPKTPQPPPPQPVVVEPPDFEDIITSKNVPHQHLNYSSHCENQIVRQLVIIPQSSEFPTSEPTSPKSLSSSSLASLASHSPPSPPAPPQTPQNREESVLFPLQTPLGQQLLPFAPGTPTDTSEELDGMQWEEFPGFGDDSTCSREQHPAKRTLLSCTTTATSNFGEASDESDDGTAPGISFAFDDFFSVYCNL